jgi:hypothetical protein
MERSAVLETTFQRMTTILINSGHKIFDVSRVRFRTRPALIAVRPLAYKQSLSVFVLRVFRNKVEYAWLMPDGGDKGVLEQFHTTFAKRDVRKKARLFSYIRQEHWQEVETLVAKEQLDEFRLLTTDARP